MTQRMVDDSGQVLEQEAQVNLGLKSTTRSVHDLSVRSVVSEILRVNGSSEYSPVGYNLQNK